MRSDQLSEAIMSCGKGRGLVWIKDIIGIGSDGFRIFAGWTDHHFVKDQQWVDLLMNSGRKPPKTKIKQKCPVCRQDVKQHY